mmetsp:Transcript_4647/g.7877  ORF Transcript_4647/g.7877 Transcript_4647/m.7877 type:complete len:368 (-) Transcript_4647:636-1739(-)
MGQALHDLERGLDGALLAEEEEPEAEGKDPGEAMLQVLLLLLKHDLGDALGGVLVARAAEDHADGERGDGLELDRVLAVDNDGRDDLEQVGSRAAGVGDGEAHEDADLVRLLGGALEAVGEDGEGGVGFVIYSTVEDAQGQVGAGLDVLLLALHVLVDCLQAIVDVPEVEQADGGGGGQLALSLVLEDPVLLALLGADEGVVAEGGVDEGVGVSEGEVLLGRVELGFAHLPLLEVRLENDVGVLGLQLVQILGELLVVGAELLLRNDLVQLLVVGLVGGALSSEHEGHLLEGDGVLALAHDLADQLHVVHLHGDAEGVWELVLLLVDLVGRRVRLHHLLGVGRVLAAGAEVAADAVVVALVAEVGQL